MQTAIVFVQHPVGPNAARDLQEKWRMFAEKTQSAIASTRKDRSLTEGTYEFRLQSELLQFSRTVLAAEEAGLSLQVLMLHEGGHAWLVQDSSSPTST